MNSSLNINNELGIAISAYVGVDGAKRWETPSVAERSLYEKPSKSKFSASGILSSASLSGGVNSTESPVKTESK